MDCTNIRKKLSAYLDDELSSREREHVERHINVCPECAGEKKSLLLISSLMDEITTEDISPFFTERVVARTKTEGVGARRLRLLRPALVGLGIIVVLLAGIIEFQYLNGKEKIEYEYLKNFDDFPPGSFSHIFVSSFSRDSK
jgi:anti-sigma factor RsiW